MSIYLHRCVNLMQRHEVGDLGCNRLMLSALNFEALTYIYNQIID